MPTNSGVANGATKVQLPEFGHAMLSQFCFRSGLVNLNHGSHGSLPRPVLDAVNELSLLSEEQPDKFLRFTSRKLLNDVRTRLAPMLNADVDECVLVPNATHGVSTVLLNIDWKDGDVIVVFSFTYAPIMRAVVAMRDRIPGLQILNIPIIFPTTRAAFLSQFRTELSSLPRYDGQKVAVLIDAIASLPGVVLPWEDMVRICREYVAWSIVDGAHQLGQVPLDLHKTDPDFWTANAHKWLLSKRASGVFYVPKRNQHLIQISLPISSGYTPVRSTTFLSYPSDLHSTSVPSSAAKSVSNAYCHALAVEGGERVAQILGTELLDRTGEWTANMTNVLLPLMLPEDLPAKESRSLIYGMTDELADEKDVMVNIYTHAGKWWVRLCAQVWNDISDFEKAGYALKGLCEAFCN